MQHASAPSKAHAQHLLQEIQRGSQAGASEDPVQRKALHGHHKRSELQKALELTPKQAPSTNSSARLLPFYVCHQLNLLQIPYDSVLAETTTFINNQSHPATITTATTAGPGNHDITRRGGLSRTDACIYIY